MPEKEVDKQFYVKKEFVLDDKKGWTYHKSGKKIERIDKETGFKYIYAEGGMNVTEPYTNLLGQLLPVKVGHHHLEQNI